MVYPILIFTLPLLLGFLMDRALGDPMRLGHPIVFFGHLIGFGEKHLNHGASRRLKGFLYNGSLVCFTFFLPLLTFAFLLIGAAINYYLGGPLLRALPPLNHCATLYYLHLLHALG